MQQQMHSPEDVLRAKPPGGDLLRRNSFQECNSLKSEWHTCAAENIAQTFSLVRSQ